MKKVFVYLCLLMANLAWGQAKKPAPVGARLPRRQQICDKPFAGGEVADGWPEGPFPFFFIAKRAKRRGHTIRRSACRIEAATPASARSLLCVDQSQVEMGHYGSGEPGYAPSWGTFLVRLSDPKIYFMGHTLDGEMPPPVKYNRGAGVGKVPTEILARWLRLVLEQKVARLKMRLKWKEYAEVSAMAFSGDGSRLVVAQLRAAPAAAAHRLHRLRSLT